MGELSLLDLKVLLIEKEVFDIERNGEKMFDVGSDELWENYKSRVFRR